jgi:hypothetical protein
MKKLSKKNIFLKRSKASLDEGGKDPLLDIQSAADLNDSTMTETNMTESQVLLKVINKK